MNLYKVLFYCVFFVCVEGAFALESPISIDSRIKTYIYNPNEIFELYTNYGYQSYIDLSPQEIVKTVAIGNAVSWNINTSGSRIFLKPLEEEGRTNMMLVTNYATYIFDLVARPTADDVMYIVRFYHPENGEDFDKEEPGNSMQDNSEDLDSIDKIHEEVVLLKGQIKLLQDGVDTLNNDLINAQELLSEQNTQLVNKMKKDSFEKDAIDVKNTLSHDKGVSDKAFDQDKVTKKHSPQGDKLKNSGVDITNMIQTSDTVIDQKSGIKTSQANREFKIKNSGVDITNMIQTSDTVIDQKSGIKTSQANREFKRPSKIIRTAKDSDSMKEDSSGAAKKATKKDVHQDILKIRDGELVNAEGARFLPMNARQRNSSQSEKLSDYLSLNYNYEYDSAHTPNLKLVEVFDDSSSTFVKITEDNTLTKVFSLGDDGKEVSIDFSIFEGYILIPGVHKKIKIVTTQGVTVLKRN